MVHATPCLSTEMKAGIQKKKVLISDVHRYVSDVSNVSKMVVTKKWPPPPEQLVSLQRLQEYQVHSPSPLPSHRTQSKVI